VQIPDVPPQLLTALVEAAEGQRLALVGGVVRDLLLHRHHQDPWGGLPDLDLVVEGSVADLLARLPVALEHQFGMAIQMRQWQHVRYGTVDLELQLPHEIGGTVLVDLATARSEVYPEPGKNPIVSPATIEHDLARRDFTVNAIAIELSGNTRIVTRLLDPYQGRLDIAHRKLRFLHRESVRDDPTRVLRGARYSARLGFDLSPESLHQIKSTIKCWPWLWSHGDPLEIVPPALSSRLKRELDILLQMQQWRQAVRALHSWGGLELLDGVLQEEKCIITYLARGERLGLPSLMTMSACAPDPLTLATRLRLPQCQLDCLRQFINLSEILTSQDLSTQKPSYCCQILEAHGLCSDAVALALIYGIGPRRVLLEWWYKWRFIKGTKGPIELIQEGFAPGPELGHELRRLRDEALDCNMNLL